VVRAGKNYGEHAISHLAAGASVICDVGDWTETKYAEVLCRVIIFLCSTINNFQNPDFHHHTTHFLCFVSLNNIYYMIHGYW